jgi:L-lactate dehydrogenase complex protein LldE
VLDYLLEAVEKPEIRSTTTVILAGYRDEIETLLAYNVGFASRFNREFSFPDYTEAQLCKIFLGMVKDRGFLLERKKDCGVSISAVMANRIHRDLKTLSERDLELIEMGDAETCCGFGGTFAAKFPMISTAMGEVKCASAADTGAEYMVSNDSSCLMHLQGLLSRQGKPLKTLHLAQILDSQ